MRRFLVLLCLVFFAGMIKAADSTAMETVSQLTLTLDALDRESLPSNVAALERMQARQAIERISSVRSRDIPDAIDEATVLTQIADFAVKAEQLQAQLVQLDREHDGILVEASRRDASLARKEAEQLRLKVLAFEEEQEQVQQETELPSQQAKVSNSPTTRVSDARAKELALQRLEEEISAQMLAKPDSMLKSKTVAGLTRYILSATAFEPGTSTLTASAKTALMQLAKKLKTNGKPIHIEAYTDAAGSEPENVLFTQKRADAVAAQFKSGGISSKKINAKGMGSSKSIANNQSKTGRALNRRIEIFQK